MSPRSTDWIFHLAIPSQDLNASAEFYEKLGCQIARRYDDRITINFFGDQVVCHLSPDNIDLEPKMYPRHFGITFIDRGNFDALHQQAQNNHLLFYQPLFIRFKDMKEQHASFFLQDPSNNLIEFKYYFDGGLIY